MAVDQQIQDVLRRIDTLDRQQSLLQETINVLKNEVNELALKITHTDAQTDVHEGIQTDAMSVGTTHEWAVKTVETDADLGNNEVVETVNESLDIGANEAIIAKNAAKILGNDPKSGLKQDVFKPFEAPQYKPPFEIKESLESFIGENLASKVGIIITVLGIAIGVKYAIDHDLISYWGRIILGYLAGCGLLEVSFKLRQKDEKYEDLSNIILGGGFASVFFVTYAAYAFYGLMPQTVAFGLMVLITVATVVAALKYDQQIIAIGGLLGAYAIPFLLSTGEDKPITLFTYVLIINIGILYVSFKRDWRILYYLAFGITWCLFLSWLNTMNGYARTGIAMTYATLFFALFYTLFLAYKFIKNEASSVAQSFILVVNSIFFYGVGYAILASNELAGNYLGVFALSNALLHLIISKVIYERDLADRKLFDLLSAFGILFVTLAIPVQFEGTLVTTLWAVEMAFLFCFGLDAQKAYRLTKNQPILFGF